MKRMDWALTARLVVLALVACTVLAVAWPLGQMPENHREKEMQAAREAIDRALIQCFALEGRYPTDVAYLQAHYGLILNTDRYVYWLDNAMPGEYMGNIRPTVRIVPREEAVDP